MIDFSLSDDQEARSELVRRFMDARATEDYLRRLDADCAYPNELYEKWAELGLLSMPFPESCGGHGGSVIDLTLITEDIGLKGYDLAGIYGVAMLNGLNILHHGTDTQRAKY